MSDIDMLDCDIQKENVPVTNHSKIFNYSKFTSRIFNVLPIFTQRKRKRHEVEDDDSNIALDKKKRNTVICESNFPISKISSYISSKLHSITFTAPLTDPKDMITNQYSEYQDYMSQREPFD